MNHPQHVSLLAIKPFDHEAYEGQDPPAPRKPVPEYLIDSLSKHGQLTPLVVHRKSGRLIDGIKRWLAFKQLAIEDAWVLFVDPVTEDGDSLADLRQVLNANRNAHGQRQKPGKAKAPQPAA